MVIALLICVYFLFGVFTEVLVKVYYDCVLCEDGDEASTLLVIIFWPVVIFMTLSISVLMALGSINKSIDKFTYNMAKKIKDRII